MNIKYYPGVINQYKVDLSISRTSGLKNRVFMAFLKGLGVLFLGAFFIVALHNTVPKPL